MAGQRAAAIIIAALLAAAWQRPAAAAGFGGSFGASSDYVHRGLTQSDNQPSLQSDLHYGWGAGWFAGLWAATVKRSQDSSAGAELNAYLGRSFLLEPDWGARLAYVHYGYPGRAWKERYDYDEAAATLAWRDRAFLSVAASPDRALDSGYDHAGRHAAFAYELALHQPLPGRFSADAGIGYYDLRRLAGSGYMYWNAGLAYELHAFELDLAYLGTNGVARRLFYDERAANRLVATLIWRF